MGKKVLAFDFGAGSGRAMVGDFDGSRIRLEEVHRFSNDPVTLKGTLYWDFLRQFYEIQQGLTKGLRAHPDIVGIGIDTWGVDYGLLDKNGRLLDMPVHYRDKRNEEPFRKVFEKVDKKTLYSRTGIQFMDFNTVFQLYGDAQSRPELLARAKTLLHMPDLFNYFLTGEMISEYSIASTSQLMDPYKGDWDYELMDMLELPCSIFRPIVDSGTRVGALSQDICAELGVPGVDVYAVAGHDTASAVAAVPCQKGENYAYLSCGTWSLLGLELKRPLINENSFAYNFTNEGGVNRTVRFLKNIIGLWLMQESRRQWKREGDDMSFADIDRLTAKAEPLARFIDCDDPSFARPGNMPARIAEYCARTGQRPPEGKGDISRCITESLALKYRASLENLETLCGRKVDVLRIIGGGVKDTLLCQYTANAIRRPVKAGPIEATALGNIAVQLMALGEFSDISQARACIAESFPPVVYEPYDSELWEGAYRRYLAVLDRA